MESNEFDEIHQCEATVVENELPYKRIRIKNILRNTEEDDKSLKLQTISSLCELRIIMLRVIAL